jgi:hypothetical protein
MKREKRLAGDVFPALSHLPQFIVGEVADRLRSVFLADDCRRLAQAARSERLSARALASVRASSRSLSGSCREVHAGEISSSYSPSAR